MHVLWNKKDKLLDVSYSFNFYLNKISKTVDISTEKYLIFSGHQKNQISVFYIQQIILFVKVLNFNECDSKAKTYFIHSILQKYFMNETEEENCWKSKKKIDFEFYIVKCRTSFEFNFFGTWLS